MDIQNYCTDLNGYAGIEGIIFLKDKCEVLCLRKESQRDKYKMVADWLDRRLARKDLRFKMDNKMNMNQHYGMRCQ